MTDQPAAPATDAAADLPPASPSDTTGPGPEAAAAPPPEPPPGLDDLMEWLTTRTPAIARAKLAQQIVKRIEDEIIDPAVVYAWDHRHQQATLRDLSAATGLNMARVTWALRIHPRADT